MGACLPWVRVIVLVVGLVVSSDGQTSCGNATCLNGGRCVTYPGTERPGTVQPESSPVCLCPPSFAGRSCDSETSSVAFAFDLAATCEEMLLNEGLLLRSRVAREVNRVDASLNMDVGKFGVQSCWDVTPFHVTTMVLVMSPLPGIDMASVIELAIKPDGYFISVTYVVTPEGNDNGEWVPADGKEEDDALGPGPVAAIVLTCLLTIGGVLVLVRGVCVALHMCSPRCSCEGKPAEVRMQETDVGTGEQCPAKSGEDGGSRCIDPRDVELTCGAG